MNEISDWIASKSVEFWVIVAIAVGLVCWFIWNRLIFARDGGKEGVPGDFPFATQNTYSGGNPLQGLQDRLNQLEDILRQVYKKLNDRHRELEQTVTSLEAAMASLEKPFKAVAERCAYGSRLLSAQQHANQPAAAPVPPQPPIPTGVPAYAGGPPVGYDSPPGYAQNPSGPRYEPIPEQSGRDESYAFRNYPK
jgi:hypothetical protein